MGSQRMSGAINEPNLDHSGRFKYQCGRYESLSRSSAQRCSIGQWVMSVGWLIAEAKNSGSETRQADVIR